MKKITTYLYTMLLAALTAGCDNFLDLPSKTSMSSEVYYQTQTDFEQAINGAYALLRNLYSGSNGAWAMGELRSDNTTYVYNPTDRGTIQAEFVKDFLDDANNSVPHHKYVTDYSIISNVNYLLEPIAEADFDEDVKRNIEGQARFLRALAYFDLVQYFGSVPLHLTPVKTMEETALPLSAPDDVYSQIIEDATRAAQLLPDKNAQEPGRATRGAARMLLGNVHIVRQEWEEAERELKQVTGYDLWTDYADAFDPAHKNGIESIFEVQFKEGNEGYASNFFYVFLAQPITAEEVAAITGIDENSYIVEGYNIPTPDIISAYEPGDTRKEASIGWLTASGNPYPYIRKYCHPHTLTNNTNDNWPVYRYAETLLLLAEALNEQNKTDEALPYLNRVRNRAGLPNTTATGKEAVREAIMQERRVELAFENKRWPDLVRSGRAETVMRAYGERVKANPQAYYFPAGYTVAANAYTDIRLLFPLPASEAALSPYF